MATEIGLHQFQNWMQQVIMHPGTDDQALSSLEAEAQISHEDALKFVVPSKTLTAVERIAIYRRMYIYRLVEVLESDFEAVAHFVGDEMFFDIVKGYVDKYPSHSYSLVPFGYNFPEYIKSMTGLHRQQFVYDLARLELAVSQVFDAPQTPLLTKEEIASVPVDAWETARFKFNGAFQVLEFRYPVNDYLQSVLKDQHNHNTKRKDTWVAVYRTNYRVWRLDLTNNAYQLIKALQEGKTLAEAIDYVVSSSKKGSTAWQKQIFEWFQEWVSEGFFQAVEY